MFDLSNLSVTDYTYRGIRNYRTPKGEILIFMNFPLWRFYCNFLCIYNPIIKLYLKTQKSESLNHIKYFFLFYWDLLYSISLIEHFGHIFICYANKQSSLFVIYIL
jgi:hypothetical protein